MIHNLVGQLPMDGADGVAVEVERRFRRIAPQGMRPDRTEVFPFPWAQLAAPAQPCAVRWTNVIVTPIPAARREHHGFRERLFRVSLQFRPRRFGPRRGSDAM